MQIKHSLYFLHQLTGLILIRRFSGEMFQSLAFVILAIHIRFLILRRGIFSVYTVLCKSNANEMRKFHSLFPRLFVESTREHSSRNLRCLERQFAKTKADISTNFRDLNDNSRSIALIRKSIYEISLRTKWLFVSIQHAIDMTSWLCNLHKNSLEFFGGSACFNA